MRLENARTRYAKCRPKSLYKLRLLCTVQCRAQASGKHAVLVLLRRVEGHAERQLRPTSPSPSFSPTSLPVLCPVSSHHRYIIIIFAAVACLQPDSVPSSRFPLAQLTIVPYNCAPASRYKCLMFPQSARARPSARSVPIACKLLKRYGSADPSDFRQISGSL